MCVIDESFTDFLSMGVQWDQQNYTKYWAYKDGIFLKGFAVDYMDI